jgi:hypothetical protein
MTPKLISLRLTDGNVIVGQLDTSCDEFVTLQFPIAVDVLYNEHTGEIGIKGTLYMPFTDESVFTFNRKHIILESTVYKSFEQYYYKFIGDSLQIANQTVN